MTNITVSCLPSKPEVSTGPFDPRENVGVQCVSALLVIVRLLQESPCTEAVLTEDASATSHELLEDDNRSSDGTGAVISGMSTSIIADPSTSQSSIEQQTNQLAAGACHL